MANPKKRKSHMRARTKRAHDHLQKINLVACPKCKNLKRPHNMCDVCKTYDGRVVIAPKVKITKEETKKDK